MGHREDMEQRIRDEALTHDPACDCKTCRAADGDEVAMRELLSELV